MTNTSLLTVAAAAGLLAACGGPAANQPANHTASAVTVYHQFAGCIRGHGDPTFPDPIVDAQGNVSEPSGTANPPDSAIQACQRILAQLPGGGPSPRNDLASLRKFSQCMRAHGITDWPDPDSRGAFPLPASFGDAGSLKSSPRWPQIRDAWGGPCAQYVKTSGGRIAFS